MTSWIDRSARERGIDSNAARAAVVVPVAGLLVLGLVRLVDKGTFRFLLEEDGLVEWLQFACFLGAAVVSVGVAARCRALGLRVPSVLYLIAAIGLIFVAGEEISWGTRLLDLDTPEWLLEVNEQEEVTVHNIEGVLFWFNLVLLGTSLYGMVADPLDWRTQYAARRPHGRALYVPPFFLVTAFAVMVTFRIYRLVVGGSSQYTVTKFIEWAELCYAGALLWFVWLARRDLRPEATGAA